MKIESEKYRFIALFTGNGHLNGFHNRLFLSKDVIKKVSPEEFCEGNWTIPLLSYELKNQFEELTSPVFSGYEVEPIQLIQPDEMHDFNAVDDLIVDNNTNVQEIILKPRVGKDEYLQNAKKILHHIQLGDVYELNYCMEFYAESVTINPLHIFQRYNAMALAPMSSYIKLDHLHIISASPERFIQRKENVLISQPIKGTRRRMADPIADQKAIQELQSDAKERAENIMIVDLVRNDFSRIATKNSVHVDELCKIYSFNTVHQSISTIRCELKDNTSFQEILRATFPMGSMTGAPKVRAMELIDQYEANQRRIYSGSVGYILPNGDFDMNVMIRTIVYDEKKKYLSFMVGSAITASADPEKEYEECMVKAEAMIKSLNGKLK